MDLLSRRGTIGVHSIVLFSGSRKHIIAIAGLIASLLVALLLAATPVASAVYKYIDENGQVAYGDRPVQGAEKLKIRTRNIPRYAAPEEYDKRNQQAGQPDKAGFTYESFELLTPKHDKVVSDRSGAVEVIFLPTPSLAPDHEIIVNVDGKDISRGRHANLSLSQVPRGSHKVSGRIESAEGKVLMKSATVTFHVRRPIIDEDSPFAFGN